MNSLCAQSVWQYFVARTFQFNIKINTAHIHTIAHPNWTRKRERGGEWEKKYLLLRKNVAIVVFIHVIWMKFKMCE